MAYCFHIHFFNFFFFKIFSNFVENISNFSSGLNVSVQIKSGDFKNITNSFLRLCPLFDRTWTFCTGFVLYACGHCLDVTIWIYHFHEPHFVEKLSVMHYLNIHDLVPMTNIFAKQCLCYLFFYKNNFYFSLLIRM